MIPTLDDIGDVAGRRVLVRADLNVPMADGAVTDATRLQAAAHSIAELADKGAKVAVLSHFGRPKGRDLSESLAPVASAFGNVLGRPVVFVADCIGPEAEAAVAALPAGGIAVMENSRFHAGEETNDPAFVAALARLGDIYVNDAFSAAHRAHASTEGLAHVLPAFAGRTMQAELTALEKALGEPEHPVAAVVGGAKVSSKLDVLTHLVSQVDHLMIGGGMANTFLAARGISVGKSLCEHNLAPTVLDILARADRAGCTVHLPYDVVVAQQFAANVPSRTVNVHEVAPDDMILDLGDAAVEMLADALKTCRTLVWNGPLGAFETPPFDRGTVALARVAAALTQSGQLLSVAGGGDTVAALNHAGVADQFSYVSTAGGAFLEWMEGKPLPGWKPCGGQIDNNPYRTSLLNMLNKQASTLGLRLDGGAVGTGGACFAAIQKRHCPRCHQQISRPPCPPGRDRPSAGIDGRRRRRRCPVDGGDGRAPRGGRRRYSGLRRTRVKRGDVVLASGSPQGVGRPHCHLRQGKAIGPHRRHRRLAARGRRRGATGAS